MDPPGFEPGVSALQGRRNIPLWLHKVPDYATGPWKFFFFKNKKGGDPAVGSPTATLWRLNPPHETQIRVS